MTQAPHRIQPSPVIGVEPLARVEPLTKVEPLTRVEIAEFTALASRLADTISTVVLGKPEVVRLALTACSPRATC